MFDTKRSYKDIFNQRADSYHEAMLRWPTARDQEFYAILDGLDVKPHQRVIDLPSGGGYLSWYASACELHHVETSELFAELCHSKSPYPSHITDLTDLPFEDNSADVVLSLAGLHHTENKSELFNELFRVLKPGGQLILADAAEGSVTARFLDGWMAAHNSMGHKGWFFNHTTIEQITEAGFSIDSVIDRHYHWCYETVEEAAQYCKLMFGIDLATIDQIVSALNVELGFTPLDSGVGLNWQLRFIRSTKIMV